MTDSPRAPAGKRERLIAGASKLVHHNGVAATTLAEIAQAADVPLGNVYYYFKSKDELIRGVVAAHIEDSPVSTQDLVEAAENCGLDEEAVRLQREGMGRARKVLAGLGLVIVIVLVIVLVLLRYILQHYA